MTFYYYLHPLFIRNTTSQIGDLLLIVVINFVLAVGLVVVALLPVGGDYYDEADQIN